MRRRVKISPVVLGAIKSGHVPKLRDWRSLPTDKLRLGEKVCRFIETHVVVPEGELVGKPMRLLLFQEVFIQSIFDGPVRARRAILSVGRKAGKTTVIAALMIAFMFMKDLIRQNSRINSAALGRDQAALVYNYMSKSLQLSPTLQGLFRSVHSGKRIVALRTGIEYQALAAEAGRAMGLSPAVIVGDEWGQVVGPNHPFIDALLTSQGAHENPLAIIISTQAPSDADFLSVAIDDATKAPSPEVVCHVYTADKDLALDDPAAWAQACPAVGEFRSAEDIRMQAEQALRLPSSQASFENLILNRRVAQAALWLAPTVWKACSSPPDLSVFRDAEVHAGLDLSMRTDLTACVLAARDPDGGVHLVPLAFTPEDGIREREKRDKAPYSAWVRDGYLIAVPGPTIDYDWLCAYLRDWLHEKGVALTSVQYDRWRIDVLKAAAERTGFAQDAEFQEVGQSFRDMSPRLETFETLLLQKRIHHGGHPLLNLGAASAVVEMDRAGGRTLAKNKSTQRIDVLVASVMAAHPCANFEMAGFDIEALIA
jgi:phage terminase large subunit-like protein